MYTETAKVLLFDVYQTLIDIDIDGEDKKENEAKAWSNFAKSLERYGIHIPTSELVWLYRSRRADFYAGKDEKIYHHDFCRIMAQIVKDDLHTEIPQEEICGLVYKYHTISRGYARLYPGVAEALTHLAERYVLAIASYTQKCFTDFELKELEIDTFFSYFLYTSDIGFKKASPKFYERCMEVIGKRAEECVMIGDNYDTDILVPQSLGMKAIWIKNPLTAPQYTHLFDNEPKNMVRVDELAALPEMIGRTFSEHG